MDKSVEFSNKAKKVHGDKYDYSEVKDFSSTARISIICKIHGVFIQRLNNHLLGRGCQECGKLTNFKSITKDTAHFITESVKIHGETYDYTKSVYTRRRDHLIITCKVHGDFSMSAGSHLMGNGCQKCGKEKSRKFNLKDNEHFLKKAFKVHGDLYDYSNVVYKGKEEKVDIICRIHGSFLQIPNNHYKGSGCPECAGTISKPEKEMMELIKSFYTGRIEPNTRSIIAPYEIDIHLPDLKLAVEFNGMFHHNEINKPKAYHYMKWQMCDKLGIRLVQIWENEWYYKKDLVEQYLRSIIATQTRLYARKLYVKPVSVEEQRSFLLKYHFQGYVGATKCLGLYLGDDLIQLMSLKRLDPQGNYEIGRLCTKSGHSVVGGSERLFKNLLQDLDYASIISFNNLDKFTGEVYSRLGMKLEKARVESYLYTDNKDVYSREQFQKHKLVAKGHDPNLTEHQIANSLGYFRIYPTGSSKYILRR